MVRTQTFQVRRDDLNQTRWLDRDVDDLVDGEVLLEVEGLALTANTMTYALTGDKFGYWQFFPASEGWGTIPTWGIARAIRSRTESVNEGERFYGFLPLATHVLVTPRLLRSNDIVDAAPHRAELPPNYNVYRNLAHDTALVQGRMPECALLRPLAMLSFLLSEELSDAGNSSATAAVLISSASSKAALMTAYLTRAKAKNPRLIGLTSSANRSFVENLGVYDQVATYDALPDCSGGISYLDFSGDLALRHRVQERYAGALVDTCIVGATHWARFEDSEATESAGATRWFFAPTVMQQKSAAWGSAEFAARFQGAWLRALDWTPGWLRIRHLSGHDGLAEAYRRIRVGDLNATEGLWATPMVRLE